MSTLTPWSYSILDDSFVISHYSCALTPSFGFINYLQSLKVLHYFAKHPSLTFFHRVKHLLSLTHFLSLNTNLYYYLSFLTHWLVTEFLTIVHQHTFIPICDSSPHYFKRSESITPLSQVVPSFTPISKDCRTLLNYVHKTFFWQWPSICYLTTFQLYLLKNGLFAISGSSILSSSLIDDFNHYLMPIAHGNCL